MKLRTKNTVSFVAKQTSVAHRERKDGECVFTEVKDIPCCDAIWGLFGNAYYIMSEAIFQEERRFYNRNDKNNINAP